MGEDINNAGSQIEARLGRFDRSDLISIIALVTSMAAFGVTVYEASILKDQQQIMQEQQRASVWPFIENDVAFRDVATDGLTIELKLVNRGLGPAKVQSCKIEIDGQGDDYGSAELTKLIRDALPEGASVSIAKRSAAGIITAGGEKLVMTIKINNVENAILALGSVNFNLSTCYCSIYDECWIADSSKNPQRSDCI